VESSARARSASGWLRGRGGPSLALHFVDGRWLLVKFHRVHRGGGLLLALLALAAAVGLGAYPLARRITRRLERLQARVDALGAGDLEARVEVEGRDEVAELAAASTGRLPTVSWWQSEDPAGARIASRAPCARIGAGCPVTSAPSQDPAAKDIAELDWLIGGCRWRLDAGRPDQARRWIRCTAMKRRWYGAEVGGSRHDTR
jgi:HAMP domain-containing protein